MSMCHTKVYYIVNDNKLLADKWVIVARIAAKFICLKGQLILYDFFQTVLLSLNRIF